jgi:hypothetical protein
MTPPHNAERGGRYFTLMSIEMYFNVKDFGFGDTYPL